MMADIYHILILYCFHRVHYFAITHNTDAKCSAIWRIKILKTSHATIF